MTKLTLAQIGENMRKKRGERGIRETAREVGISPATLSRVERGNLPDLTTFGKMCIWLRIDPAMVLGVERPVSPGSPAQPAPLVASAHFRAGQTVSPELARALAELILSAQRMMAGEPPQE